MRSSELSNELWSTRIKRNVTGLNGTTAYVGAELRQNDVDLPEMKTNGLRACISEARLGIYKDP